MIRVIEYHVPCHYDFMVPCQSYHARLRARGVQGALPHGRGVCGGLSAPPRQQGVWGAARPPMETAIRIFGLEMTPSPEMIKAGMMC